MVLPSNLGANSLSQSGQQEMKQLGGAGTSFFDSTMKDGDIGSRQFVTLVDVIGEGQIAGFPSAIDAGLTHGSTAYRIASLKDLFLNGTQVLRDGASNTDPDINDFNFGTSEANAPSFFTRLGTSNQTKIQGLVETERDRTVGVTVTQSQSQTVTITDTSTDGVRVTIGFPRLQEIKDNGDIKGTTVEYEIEVRNQANTLIKKINRSGNLTGLDRSIHTGGGLVTGKSTSPYFKDHIIVFPEDIADSDFPVTVKVSRITADSSDAKLANAFEFTTLTELVFDSPTYLNTAYAAIRFDSEIFRQVPQRMYRVRGRLVKIPHNSTVRADGSLSFSGDFNGTLKSSKEYCNDPAWVLYDILTESVAGFGDFVAETEVDKYSFYNASVYNSELIDNGEGGTAPRFSCNIVIQRSTNAYTLLDRIASIMRGSLYIDDGVITLCQDRPTTSTYFFSYANITEDGFVYTGASQRTKDTVINVKYFSNETRSFEYETVEDTAANQSKYGVVVKNIEAVGCNNQAQARRAGLWHLFTQNNETETVAFTTTADAGSLVRPNQIITVQDPVRSGVRRSGRIKTATTTQITVDNTKDLPTSHTTGDQLSVILTDGTMETKTVSDITGSVITVSSAFTSAPQAFSVWLLLRATTETEDFRVLSVTEEDNTFTINAMFHNSSKYAFVEDGASVTVPQITTLLQPKPAPSNLSAEELIVALGNRAVSKLVLSWQPVSGVTEYLVKYQFNDGNVITQRVTAPTFEIFDSELGEYKFEVFSYNALGEPSTTPTTLTFNAEGKTALPADVQNLTIEPYNDDFVKLRFDKSTDVDVIHGGTVVVRHSNLTDGTGTFTNSVDLIAALSGNISETLIPAIAGEVILKFRDDGGRLSSGETSVIISPPDQRPKLTAFTDREDTDTPPFGGTKTNTFFDSTLGGLTLGSLVTIDEVTALIDTLSQIDILGDVASTGSYEFANPLDLGATMDTKLTRHFVTESFYAGSLIDQRTALIDTWDDIDQLTAFGTNAKLLVATTTQDPSLSTSATYAQSGTTITITKSSHGYTVGSFVVVDFTSGNGVDGNYEIKTVPNSSTFTLTATASQTTSGNCTYGAEFSDFNVLTNGVLRGRGFKFKVDLSSEDPAQTILLKELGYSATLNRRVETVNSVIASGTSTKAVTFTDKFFTGFSGTDVAAGGALPTIGIVIENASSGDFFSLSNISSTGFSIDIKNGSSHVDRNFKYTAVGFGRGS
tara:strand:- start:1425 stop:5114 length:3690 start_codon:yes stop_codon:yes gene_type:complete